jgi:hypothetical protein
VVFSLSDKKVQVAINLSKACIVFCRESCPSLNDAVDMIIINLISITVRHVRLQCHGIYLEICSITTSCILHSCFPGIPWPRFGNRSVRSLD